MPYTPPTLTDNVTAATAANVSSWLTSAAGYGGANQLPADNGLLTWNYDNAVIIGGSNPTAGQGLLMRCPVRTDMTIGSVVVVVTTAGTGATALANCYVGLYDKTGARRGVSADQSTTFATIGAKSVSLTADAGGLTILGTDDYCYLALLIGTQSTTAVQFGRSNTTSQPGQLMQSASTTPPARWLFKGALSTLPTTVDYTTCSVPTVMFWIGGAA